MAQARNGCPFMPTCGHVFARRGVVVGAPDAGSVDLDECVDGVAPLGHLVAVIVDLPSSALWAVPLTVAIGTVDGRQETAGHACYESTAKRAKPPLRAALMTLHGSGVGSHAASCDAMVRTDADGVAVLGGLCGDRARGRAR